MYVKLFSQILDSSIADDRRLRHFFTDLLLCADGKGYVMMTEGALARRIGATLDEVKWGLDALQQPDPMSKTPAAEGRRIERLDGVGYGWRILNYEHYRAMKDADQLREATKERVRRHREKKSGNVTETPGNTVETSGNAPVTPGNSRNAIAEAEGKAESDISESNDSSPEAGTSGRVESTGITECFHQLCPSLPKVQRLTDQRKTAIKARWRASEGRGLEWFKELFTKAEASDWLTGRSGKWAGCSFDWLMNPTNCQRVMEGNYANDRNKVNGHSKPGPNFREGIDPDEFQTWLRATYPRAKPDLCLDTANADLVSEYARR